MSTFELRGDYPEHEKLSKIKDKSQAIGEFLDWLPGVIAKHHEHDHGCWCDDPFHESDDPTIVRSKDRCPNPVCDGHHGSRRLVCGYGEHQLQPWRKNIQDWLAEYFGIDRQRIEEEKRAMLEELRANARRVRG